MNNTPNHPLHLDVGKDVPRPLWWQNRTPVRKLRKLRPLDAKSLLYRFAIKVLRRTIILKTQRIEDFDSMDLIPKTGAAIVIAPHLKEFDALIAPELVTRTGRPPRIFAKASLWKIPIVKQVFNAGGLIPVERGTEKAAASLDLALEKLQNGDIVFIFPEGTVSKDKNHWPMTAKTGAARLALQSGAPVIPVLQDGAQFLGKKYRKSHKKVTVYTKVYPAIDFSTVADYRGEAIKKPTARQIDDANSIIEDTLTRIIELNRGQNAPLRYNAKAKRRLSREESRALNKDVEIASTQNILDTGKLILPSKLQKTEE
jgi:1-acyl-sn-glycerol-3-phosphate acyltransferase